jgi:steroid 5-alpha reductase family enzyme
MHLGTLVLVSAIAILAFMTVVWLVSLAVGKASVVDVVWSVCFVIAAAIALWFGAGVFERRLLVAVLTTVWGARLAIHIFRRNLGKPEDHRYQAFRERFGEHRYWWVSLFQVFWLQGAIAMVVAAPIFVAGAGETPRSLTALDLLGALVWALGFGFEAVGDLQLDRFTRDPANRGRVMDRGLWRYTRHPNYFGDACVWWGIGLIGLVTPWGWLALAGPALMTFLLVRVSGVAMLERSIGSRRPGYAEYVRRTSAFVPMPPKRAEA